MPSSPFLAVALLLLLLGALPASADEVPAQGTPPPRTGRPLAAPGGPDWQPLHFPKISRHTRYTRRGTTVESHSDCSASALILRLDPPVDLRQWPRLRWRWQLTRPLEPGPNEREKAGDDFAARVYALFEFDPQRSTLWERLQRRLGKTLYGEGLPGKGIAYVWARSAQTGNHWPNPYTADTRVSVLRSAADRDWQSESVDLLADHEALLGPAHVPLMAIAIMTDSDDGCSTAGARYADFELLPPGPTAP
jgi:hypothetical protein